MFCRTINECQAVAWYHTKAWVITVDRLNRIFIDTIEDFNEQILQIEVFDRNKIFVSMYGSDGKYKFLLMQKVGKTFTVIDKLVSNGILNVSLAVIGNRIDVTNAGNINISNDKPIECQLGSRTLTWYNGWTLK